MVKLYVARDKKMVDVSRSCGEITWGDGIDSLGVQLTFSTEDFSLSVGDYFQLKKDNQLVTDGIAVREDKGFYRNTINVFDFAWYLNESEEVIQFKNMSCKRAIEKLLNQYNIPIGNLELPDIIFSYLYKDKKISEIIKHILSILSGQTGQKFRMEMRQGKFYIEKYSELVVDPGYKNAINLGVMKSLDYIDTDFSYSESIEAMKNKVVLVSNSEQSTAVIESREDQESINRYGLLKEVKTLDDEDISQAKNIAKNMLADLNRLTKDISINILGDINLRSGRYLTINNQFFSGKFLIKNTSHSYSDGIHKTSLTLGDDKNDVG